MHYTSLALVSSGKSHASCDTGSAAYFEVLMADSEYRVRNVRGRQDF